MLSFQQIFAGATRREGVFWALCLAAMVAFIYPADERVWHAWFSAGDDVAREQLNGYLYHHAAVLVCFTLPLLLTCDIVTDRKSTRLNSSHVKSSYAVF